MNAPGWRSPARAGLGAALFWALWCVRWFDAAAPLRPGWLSALPPASLLAPLAVFLGLWLRGRWTVFFGPPALRGLKPGLVLVLALAAAFRLPIAWPGAAGSVTPDGALSGIVALHVRDGAAHDVFVPHVPYSGSLKSHLAAPLAALVDGPRAFALASLAFYLLFVAAAYGLALRVGGSHGGRVALLAGLYLAFSPPYLTRYSLSNDGNYVEVLALGTLALLVAARWIEVREGRAALALAGGLLLGLAFWCHILAVIHLTAFGLVLLAAAPRDALRSAPFGAWGFVLGDLPGLVWNATHEWRSFQYLVPGGSGEEAAGPSLGARALGLLTDQLPFLLGYDPGYGKAVDAVLRGVGFLGLVLVTWSFARAAGRLTREPRGARFVIFTFALVNLAVAVFALPQIPGNPRYLLFLMAPIAVFLADACASRPARAALGLLVAGGALGSMAQRPGILAAEAKWRTFVADLQAEGVRYCYTDFYLASKINFVSEEGVICTAKLGPTTTEYFFEYRERVERASDAALVPVNHTAARRLERRLSELGVAFERRDFMKPTLLGLSRKVDPEELFPGREFPWR